MLTHALGMRVEGNEVDKWGILATEGEKEWGEVGVRMRKEEQKVGQSATE